MAIGTTGLHHLRITVTDLERSRAFYQDPQLQTHLLQALLVLQLWPAAASGIIIHIPIGPNPFGPINIQKAQLAMLCPKKLRAEPLIGEVHSR